MPAFLINLLAAVFALFTHYVSCSGSELSAAIIRPFGEQFWGVLVIGVCCSILLALIGSVLAIVGLCRQRQQRWNVAALLLVPAAWVLLWMADNYGWPFFL